MPSLALLKQDEERERLRRQVTDLETELRQRDEAIRAHKAELATTFASGKAEGRLLALTEAQDRQAERMTLLEAALRLADAHICERLSSLDRLAALLAQECLDIILGDRNARSDFLRQIIDRQIAEIEKSLLIGLKLSPEDFPDRKSLDALAKEVGMRATTVTTADAIPTGGCVLTLRLGEIDVGINQQWSVLRDTLSQIAAPAEEL